MVRRLKTSLSRVRAIGRGLRGRMLLLSMIPLAFMGVLLVVVQFAVQDLNKNLKGVIENAVPSISTSIEMGAILNRIDAKAWKAIAVGKESSDYGDQVDEFGSGIDQFESAVDRY